MVVADCTICLERIMEEAELDSCMHRFCFTCITKWSAAVTTCPLCKASFSTISNLSDGFTVVIEKEKLAMEADYTDLAPSENEEESDGEWEDEEENEEDREFIAVDGEVDLMYLEDGDADFEGDYTISSASEEDSEEEDDPIPEDEVISLHEASIVDNDSFIRSAARRVMNFMSRSPRTRPQRSQAAASSSRHNQRPSRSQGQDEEGWITATRSGPSVYARSTRSGVRRGRNPPRASRSTDLSRSGAFDHYRDERIRRSGRVAARDSRARPY